MRKFEISYKGKYLILESEVEQWYNEKENSLWSELSDEEKLDEVISFSNEEYFNPVNMKPSLKIKN